MERFHGYLPRVMPLTGTGSCSSDQRMDPLSGLCTDNNLAKTIIPSSGLHEPWTTPPWPLYRPAASPWGDWSYTLHQVFSNHQMNNVVKTLIKVTKIPTSTRCSPFTEKKQNTNFTLPVPNRGQQTYSSNTRICILGPLVLVMIPKVQRAMLSHYRLSSDINLMQPAVG